MKLPLSWIREFIDIDLPAPQIAKMLTQAGLEVESLSFIHHMFDNVVVCKVIQAEKHPNADKLTLATVTDGTEQFQVVCGAPNCRTGLRTALAKVGAKLRDDKGKEFLVKKANLRGVESFGMLCSEKELGLSENNEGIIEFADHIKEGTDVVEIYGDTIFEIGLTPNLGHCASVLGVARELSAMTGLPFKIPRYSLREMAQQPIENYTKVEVLDEKKCPRYGCRVIQNVQIGPSPDWLQQRLLACDQRPINNIVDITNLVLMELGHPLHAFDYDLLKGHHIIVRPGKEGEKFVTLDGKERTMSAEDLMICDQERPVAIAGVMGGQNSEVNDKTKNILLEAAFFQPTSIRRTSKRLGLQTEGSRRFEKGCDPNQVILALDRAALLMQEIAGGKVCAGVLDVKKKEFAPKAVHCRLSRANAILGTQLSLSEVEMVFQRLGMGYKWDGQDTFTISVPTYRFDIQGEIDLIEEVARIYGFDNIPKKDPHYTSSKLAHASIYLFEKKMRSQLMSEGLQEFLTCDLIGPALLNIVHESVMDEEAMVKVVNPTSIEQSILRTSLMPGLLQAIKFNYDRQNHDISAFEIGRIHFKKGDQYKEQSMAGIVLMGKSRPQHWERKPADVDFYDLKGIVENILESVGAEGISFQRSESPLFHPGRQAAIFAKSIRVGTFGEVHPSIIRRLDVPQRVYFAEMDLHDLVQVMKKEFHMVEIPIYPGSSRDLTLTMNETTSVQEILDTIRSIPSPLLEKVMVVDLFRSEKIGKGNKNVTFHFVYRDKSKTVSQVEVDREHERLLGQIKSIGGQREV